MKTRHVYYHNAKTSRPSVCNAMEVLLVHQDKAASFLPRLEQVLVAERKEAGLEPIHCVQMRKLVNIFLDKQQWLKTLTLSFLDYVLAIKVVSSLEEAVAHIEAHSTHHSDAIVTENAETAAYFTDQVDSAAVYV